MAEPTSTISRDDEQWKPAPGFDGHYSVSNLGRVRSEIDSPTGWPGYIMKPDRLRTGYLRASLGGGHGKRRRCLVHRMVAAAFIGPCPPGHVVNHRDGDKSNNRPENLEYVTPARNSQHAMQGMARGANKLCPAKVAEIHRLAATGMLQREIGDRVGVSQPTVSMVLGGHRWGHVVRAG